MVLLVTGVIVLIAAFHIWQRRDSRGGWPLFLLFVAIFEWALATGLEAATVQLDLKNFWSRTSYYGTQFSAPLLLLFALGYTGREKKASPLITTLLFVVPVAITTLALTSVTFSRVKYPHMMSREEIRLTALSSCAG